MKTVNNTGFAIMCEDCHGIVRNGDTMHTITDGFDEWNFFDKCGTKRAKCARKENKERETWAKI